MAWSQQCRLRSESKATALNYSGSSCVPVLVAGSCFQREGGEPGGGHRFWVPCLPRHLACPLSCSVLCFTPHAHSRGSVRPPCCTALGTAPLAPLNWRGRPCACSFLREATATIWPTTLSILSRARLHWRLSSARLGLRAGRGDCCRPRVPIGPDRARASRCCPQSWQPAPWSAAAERAPAAASVPRRRGRRGQSMRSCSAPPTALARWVSAVRCPVGWVREGDGRGRGAGARRPGEPRAACPRGRARGAAGPGAGLGQRIRSSRRPPSLSVPVWVGAAREGRRPDAPARSGHGGLLGILGAFAALTSLPSRGARVLGHGRRRPRAVSPGRKAQGARAPCFPRPLLPGPPCPLPRPDPAAKGWAGKRALWDRCQLRDKRHKIGGNGRSAASALGRGPRRRGGRILGAGQGKFGKSVRPLCSGGGRAAQAALQAALVLSAPLLNNSWRARRPLACTGRAARLCQAAAAFGARAAPDEWPALSRCSPIAPDGPHCRPACALGRRVPSPLDGQALSVRARCARLAAPGCT